MFGKISSEKIWAPISCAPLPSPILQPAPLRGHHHPKFGSLSSFFPIYSFLSHLYAVLKAPYFSFQPSFNFIKKDILQYMIWRDLFWWLYNSPGHEHVIFYLCILLLMADHDRSCTRAGISLGWNRWVVEMWRLPLHNAKLFLRVVVPMYTSTDS